MLSLEHGVSGSLEQKSIFLAKSLVVK